MFADIDVERDDEPLYAAARLVAPGGVEQRPQDAVVVVRVLEARVGIGHVRSSQRGDTKEPERDQNADARRKHGADAVIPIDRLCDRQGQVEPDASTVRPFDAWSRKHAPQSKASATPQGHIAGQSDARATGVIFCGPTEVRAEPRRAPAPDIGVRGAPHGRAGRPTWSCGAPPIRRGQRGTKSSAAELMQ